MALKLIAAEGMVEGEDGNEEMGSHSSIFISYSRNA